MKTRLNKTLRHQLQMLVDKSYDPLTQARLDAARVVGTAAVVTAMQRTWPAEEMAVLKKYNLIVDDGRSKWVGLMVVHPDGRGVQHVDWSVAEDKDAALPSRPVCLYSGYRGPNLRIDQPDEVAAVSAYLDVAAEAEKARRERHSAFTVLIKNARNLEDIEAVWPDAKKVRPATPNLPAIQVSVLLDRVREIVEADRKAREILANEKNETCSPA